MRRVRIPLFLLLGFLAAAVSTAELIAAPARAPIARASIATAPIEQPGIASEIRAQAKGQLKKFYSSRGFSPLWASTGRIGSEGDTLLGFLTTADLDGLKPSSYKIGDIRDAIERARSGDPKLVARAELQLSNAFSRYVSDMRRPSKLRMTYLDVQLKPKKLKQETVLRAAALPPSFKTYLSSMAWMSPHYVKMRALLARAEERGSSGMVLRRLRLNLDRARPLPGPWTHHIVVDAASGQLWFYQAGKQAGSMRVVVGKPEAPTPMLAGMLQYAILNPYWNVPVDLARTLVAPKVLAGRSLGSMGFEALSDWSVTPVKLDPASIDWPAVASGAQELRIRQLPGGTNSMGKVKFMFPNDSGIYLHDTPDRELFTKESRHFSNGCIRLEDAPGLGKWLLGKPIRASSKKPEQAVALTVPMPVYLTYFTAIETKQGVGFLEDVYGRDR
jgi:L,D-transpeptidase YcbB